MRELIFEVFGSAARGEMGLNNDLDVLVVVPDGTKGEKCADIDV